MRTELQFAAHAYMDRLRRKQRSFPGNAADILGATLDALWNDRYYAAGLHHYTHFWVRDFGLAMPGIVAAGEGRRARDTLTFVLDRYQELQQIGTLAPGGTLHRFPGFALDNLAWLLHALRELPAYDVAYTYAEFLNAQLAHTAALLESDGFVKAEVRSFGIRDHVQQRGSCYDAALLWRMADDARALGLADIPQCTPEQFRKRYWNGSWYREDMQSDAVWSADANLFPFLVGLDTSPERFRNAMAGIWEHQQHQPYPLAYAVHEPERFNWAVQLFMKDSQGPKTRWPILGALLLELLEHFHDPRAAALREQLTAMLERFGFFPEILNEKGGLYLSPWYRSDAGMLWGTRLLAPSLLR